VAEVLPSAVQLAGVWLVATLLSSVLSALFYPPFRRAIGACDAATRSLATLCYTVMAPAVGCVTVLLSAFPEYGRLLVPAHCHSGDCGMHAPLVAADSIGGMGLLILASLLVFAAAAGVSRVIVYGKRRLETLFALGNRRESTDHLVIDSRAPVALCCGLVRQRIVVSRALVERLDSAELEVVLAHERAHAARFDNLRNLTGCWSTALWPSSRREIIRADLRDDGEHACDALALRVTSDPQLFRRVVEIVASGAPGTPAVGHARFCGRDADGRLEAASRRSATSPAFVSVLIASIWSLQVAAATALSHPLVEAIASINL